MSNTDLNYKLRFLFVIMAFSSSVVAMFSLLFFNPGREEGYITATVLAVLSLSFNSLLQLRKEFFGLQEEERIAKMDQAIKNARTD